MKINDFINTLSDISPNDLNTFYELFDSFINNNITLSDLNNKIYQIRNNLNNKFTPLENNGQYSKIKNPITAIEYLDKIHNTISKFNKNNISVNSLTENIVSKTKKEISNKAEQPSNNTIAQIVAYDLLDEYDFTNKDTVGFIYKDKIYPNKEYPKIITWKYLFKKTCDILFSDNPTSFNEFPKIYEMQGRQLTYFSYEKDEATLSGKRPLQKPQKIKFSNVYIETSLNTQQITKTIKKMLLKYNTLSNYKILILEKNTFPSKENNVLLSPEVEPIFSTNISTDKVLKTNTLKENYSKYTCVYYDIEKNFCKKTKTNNCYSAKLNCSNYKQKENINTAKDIILQKQDYLTNTNNTKNISNNSNKILSIENKSIKKINDTSLSNLKNNTIVPQKKPIIYILRSIKTCPCCKKDLISIYTKILFIKNNKQEEKTLFTKKCSNCNKLYVLKEVYTSFINNKNINTMNYAFLEGTHLTTSNHSNINFLLDITKNNLKPIEQIISLNDDFSKLSNTIPINLYFNNHCYSLTKWSDILKYLSQELYIIDPIKFKNLPKQTVMDINGTLRFKIAFDSIILKKPFKIKNSPIFIDLDISSIELQTLINKMLKIYNIDKTLLFIKIYYLKSLNN